MDPRIDKLLQALQLLAARQDEIEARFESTGILGALAVHEEVVRLVKQAEEAKYDYESRQLSGEEDLIGDGL